MAAEGVPLAHACLNVARSQAALGEATLRDALRAASRDAVEALGAERVNLVAHSMGGLDARCSPRRSSG